MKWLSHKSNAIVKLAAAIVILSGWSLNASFADTNIANVVLVKTDNPTTVHQLAVSCSAIGVNYLGGDNLYRIILTNSASALKLLEIARTIPQVAFAETDKYVVANSTSPTPPSTWTYSFDAYLPMPRPSVRTYSLCDTSPTPPSTWTYSFDAYLPMPRPSVRTYSLCDTSPTPPSTWTYSFDAYLPTPRPSARTYSLCDTSPTPPSTWTYSFDAYTNPSNPPVPSSSSLVNLPGNADDGSGVTVAVLDTGIDLADPNISPSLIPGVNVVEPGLPPNALADGRTNSLQYHGTEVAGILLQVAPAANIMPVKVLNADGVGSISNVIVGIEYAIHHGARVLNLSLGTPAKTLALSDVIAQAERAGVVVVASAGNSNTSAPAYPASLPGVIAVAAINPDTSKSAASSYGSDISVVAPSASGTSLAAPYVSGEAAAILSLRPTATPSWVAGIIKSTAHSVDGANPQLAGELGAGLIDVSAAEQMAASSR